MKLTSFAIAFAVLVTVLGAMAAPAVGEIIAGVALAAVISFEATRDSKRVLAEVEATRREAKRLSRAIAHLL